jgi:hypothetical protein
MIMAANPLYKNITANYIYILSIVSLMSFIALNGHNQDIYRSFHSKKFFLSINLLRRYVLIFVNSILLNVALYTFFYFTNSEFIGLMHFIFCWQFIYTVLLLNFEYFLIKDCGIYAYIFSNTTLNVIVAVSILASLYTNSTLDLGKIIKINYYSALGVAILFLATAMMLGIQRVRLKKVHKYYFKNIYIASISIFSIGLYNLDLIFIKIGYDQDVFSSYALGSKLASILLMINSYAYAIAPKLIKNKNPIDAFNYLEQLKKKLVLINLVVGFLIALYIISIYGITEDILIIFIIFSLSNLINIGFGIRLPIFILIKSENVVFNISKYIFMLTIITYLLILKFGVNITLASVLLSSIIIIQSYIESTRLKRLLNV